MSRDERDPWRAVREGLDIWDPEAAVRARLGKYGLLDVYARWPNIPQSIWMHMSQADRATLEDAFQKLMSAVGLAVFRGSPSKRLPEEEAALAEYERLAAELIEWVRRELNPPEPQPEPEPKPRGAEARAGHKKKATDRHKPVKELLDKHPDLSIGQIEQKTGVPKTTVRRIRAAMRLHPKNSAP